MVKWTDAVAAIGRPGLDVHDLRHTGDTLASASKVSTRNLMARMGHHSMAATIIYQHASRAADTSIAEHMNAQLVAGDQDVAERDEGAAGVLVPVG
ncbi:MAG: hypothetical protein J2P17_35835 [Mycobacterium sp.]|nr:hypothetical protein [Mycobacterium sp.]